MATAMKPELEKSLMLRVQAGDLDAFQILVERHQRLVYGLAMSILRNPEDAEEVAQDAFLKLFRARDQFDHGRALEPWLLRIAGNACRDRLRRRRAATLPSLPQLDAAELAQVLPDPRQDRSEQERMQESVRTELGHLSDRTRLPLELKYLRGMTNQQIADALGISVSNVKVQLARGKDILAMRLERVFGS